VGKIVTFCVSLFCISAALSAPNEYITYLSNHAPWKSYVPSNFEIVQKKGEAAFYWTSDADDEQISEVNYLSKEPYPIYKPNVTIEAQRKTQAGLLIYKNKYTIDAFSRRLIANQIELASSKRNVVFLGCSFTFGTGVADDENFPFYFSKYRTNFNVYNLGIYKAGANDILDDLRLNKRLSDISKNGGLVVYTAIYDHIERSVCNYSCYGKSYRDWVLKKSNYQYDPASKSLLNRGSFEESRTCDFNDLQSAK
jgi:hypothetical protein